VVALRYLLDEHLRGPLRRAIQWHNSRGVYPLDVVRVGDFVDLPLGTADAIILLWAEREGRILVSHDRNTLPGHLSDHLRTGRHSPGIFLIRRHTTVTQLMTFLIDAAYASDPVDWQDRIAFMP